MDLSRIATVVGYTAATTVANKLFIIPPTPLIENHVTALQTLGSVISQLYPFSSLVENKSTGKIPTKDRLFTLHHLTISHRKTLSEFLSTEFVTPINLLLDYGKLYVKAICSMYLYAIMIDPEQSATGLEYRDPPAGFGLEKIRTAIIEARQSAQNVSTSLEDSQRKLWEISVSWRESVQWMDKVVALDNKKSGTAWCSELLCDVLVNLENLKESYRPLIDFFNLQEAHLKLLQERIFSDANSRSDYDRLVPITEASCLPSLPVMPFPWDTVTKRASGVVRQWVEFTAPAKIFLYFHHYRNTFMIEVQAISEIESQERSRRGPHRLRNKFNKVFRISEVDVY